MDETVIKHSNLLTGYYEELNFPKQRNSVERDTTTRCKHENDNLTCLYTRINKVPQKKSKYIHGNKIKRKSKTKDFGLKPNNVNVESFGKLNQKYVVTSKHVNNRDEMYNDYVNVEQGTSKDTTVCSNDVKLVVSKAIQQNVGPNKANSGYTSDTGLPLLDKFYTYDKHNSSIASIETDNLKEGLKSIDNPVFEVILVRIMYYSNPSPTVMEKLPR